MCEFFIGGLAQLARASALHAEGHRFESDILHSLRRRDVPNNIVKSETCIDAAKVYTRWV